MTRPLLPTGTADTRQKPAWAPYSSLSPQLGNARRPALEPTYQRTGTPHPRKQPGMWRAVKEQIPGLPHLIALSGAHSTGVQAVGGVRAVTIPFSCPRVCKTGKRKPGLCRAQFPLTHTVSRVRASVTPIPSSASLQAGSPELWAWCVWGAP